ncbi:serine hydrolase domain-containing protein [Burkholderia gladioli]|uniref:serine hydrolase domain-containing protein n=1 Tax=Burkholderia gladioli TaxID=28095 RepID=UPI00163F1A46|nr:serine hydrolase [Burkholderia gladioli]
MLAVLSMAALAAVGAMIVKRPAPAANPWPASDYWQPVDASRLNVQCRRRLDEVRHRLQTLPTTSLMAVRGDQVLFHYGSVNQPSLVYSVRKSILAMMYGKPVSDGRIQLDANLATLGIDDLGGLLPIERQARVRDLLAARSGVYHAAANAGDNATSAPPRGSQKPGSYFLYNNWDFNAAGAVFEQQTGRDIYRAFAEDFAAPLGMEDFELDRQHRGGDPARSRYLAYHFRLSTRDMARLGELMLRDGDWHGNRLLPTGWVRTITTPVTLARDMHPPHVARRGLDYGFLWWIPEEPADSPLDGSYLAWGFYGQYILVVPRRGMVIVHKRDVALSEGEDARWVYLPEFMEIARELVEAPCA